MAGPIYNPVIPFLGAIPGGFLPGRMIRIQGTVPYGAQRYVDVAFWDLYMRGLNQSFIVHTRFAFNLQCGPNTDPRDDIALHINFRFPERCVVRNHLQAMSWGPEETAGGMPLQPGAGFETLILCDHSSIKVAVNGAHFCEFVHRLPYQRVTYLTIDGEVQVQCIGFEGDAPPMQQGYMPQQQSYGPGYGQAPPPYSQPAYGGGMMSQQQVPMQMSQPMQQQPATNPQGQVQQQQRSGMGTGAAVGLGVGALAAGGLAGYALGGGFSSDSPHEEEVSSFGGDGDFGGDDWAD